MPRPKEFAENIVLKRAMDLFWRQGYEATSLQDLEQAMGMGRQSIYNAFGDKHRLFLTALDRYYHKLFSGLMSALERRDASLSEVRDFFRNTVNIYAAQKERRACLLVNATMELALRDASVAERIRVHQGRVESAFRHALRNAREKGELARRVDPDVAARSLTCTTLGLAVLAKGGASKQTLRDAAKLNMVALAG